MYAGVDCFWLKSTGRMKISLRRFTFGDRGRDCPKGNRGHNANADIDLEITRQTRIEPDGWEILMQVDESLHPPRDDPRWPTVCESCGEPFQDDDEWQVNQKEIYESEGGKMYAFRGYGDKSAAGALFDCWWLHGRKTIKNGKTYTYVGQDNIALVGICPNGFAWEIDGPSANGNGWTRTGDPREPKTLSVTPSIVAGDYHGYLTNGFFTDG